MRSRVTDPASHLDALAEHVQALEGDDTGRPHAWRHLLAALDWLYRAEELCACADPGYYTRRDSCDDGRALAGLIYVRGVSVHHQADLSARLWPTQETKMLMGGVLKPAKPLMYTGTELVTPQRRILAPRWPRLDQLPPPGRPERRGRDVMYEEQVAGKRLVTPLQAAARFLRTR